MRLCLKQILPGPYNMDYAVHDNVITSSLVKDLPWVDFHNNKYRNFWILSNRSLSPKAFT